MMEVYVSEQRKEPLVPIREKYMLTLKESAAYFNINEKRIRRVLEDHPGELGLFNGTKVLINRGKFEEFLDGTSAI
ncbi:MAG: excisionase [Butyrivibrio sp.]|jgi:hypothetical protein|nr:excisionase [Butyrivibrio sp.]